MAALGRQAAESEDHVAVSDLFDIVPAEVAADEGLPLDRLTLSSLGGRVVDSSLGYRAGGIATSLSRAAGVPEISPILEVALPLGLVRVAETEHEQGLDAGGLAAALRKETAALSTIGDEKAGVAVDAFADAARQEELRSEIGEEDWTVVSKVRRFLQRATSLRRGKSQRSRQPGRPDQGDGGAGKRVRPDDHPVRECACGRRGDRHPEVVRAVRG